MMGLNGRNDIKEFVFAFLRSKGPIPGKTETEQLQCEYLDLGVIDSMQLVEMVLEIEKRFGIHFEPEHLQSVEFRTIGGTIGLVARLLAGKA